MDCFVYNAGVFSGVCVVIVLFVVTCFGFGVLFDCFSCFCCSLFNCLLLYYC